MKTLHSLQDLQSVRPQIEQATRPELARQLNLDTDTYARKAAGLLFSKLGQLAKNGIRIIREGKKIKRVDAYIPGQGMRLVKPIVEVDVMYFIIKNQGKPNEVRIVASESFPSLQVTADDFR
jgi:hypothetical protein